MSEEWTEEQVNQINAEMAAGCLDLIRELLVESGINMDRTPPMMYPEAICTMVTQIVEAKTAALTAERDTMRGILESMANDCWDGNNIEGGWFEDTMVAAGLMVKVSASDEYREEYDSEWMYQLAWKVEP